jgi:branched-chain amino acid transport system substrate-binding protein
MKRTIKIMSLLVFICFLMSLVVTVQPVLAKKDKDKIVIGASRSLSGPLAFFEENAFGPLYKMWVKKKNAEGGLYVKEYGKKLPIEMLVYDDKSDMGTMTRLLDKLIVQDKVDLIFPPISTAFLFAASAVANRHHYVLIGAEGGATSLSEIMDTVPYFFMVLEFSNHYQMPVMADVFEEVGVKSVAINFIEDLHGIEYSGEAAKELNKKGIEVRMIKSTPPDIKDVSPILKEAQRLNVDAYISFTYPPVTFPTVLTAQAIGYNPKVMFLGPGGNFEVIKAVCGGDEVIEGIMGEGAWNAKSSKAHAQFVEDFLAAGNNPMQLDWWGHDVYWAALEVLEQAILKTGTLNHDKLRKAIATEKFNTILGKTWFEDQMLARECYAGQVGQWQKGIFEVIDPGPKRTAAPIYPKPHFPAPKPK